MIRRVMAAFCRVLSRRRGLARSMVPTHAKCMGFSGTGLGARHSNVMPAWAHDEDLLLMPHGHPLRMIMPVRRDERAMIPRRRVADGAGSVRQACA
jgi:hypothetical protein